MRTLLQDPRYIGMQVWGRTTAYLSGPVKQVPLQQWAICENAFEPIISQELFLRAQQRFANFRLSDEQMLDRLRQLYRSHGKLTGKIIYRSSLCPGLSTYHKRFGGLLGVYARLGYDNPKLRAKVTTRQSLLLLRRTLIKSLVETFPNDVEVMPKTRRLRGLLRLRKTGLLISIALGRYCAPRKGWLIEIPKSERKRPTIVALTDDKNESLKSLMVFPKVISKDWHPHIKEGSEWIRSGEPLEKVSDFLVVLERVRKALT